MSTPRSLDGLLAHAHQRRTTTRGKINKALRDMRKQGLAINANAVARRAGVTRKTIYNHPDLLELIRAQSTNPAPTAAPAAAPATATGESGVVTALRQQLRAQEQHYQGQIAELKAEQKKLEQALAVAHGELHRLTKTTESSKSQRG